MTPTPTFEHMSLLYFIVGLFAVLGAVASFTAIMKNLALWRASKKPSQEEAVVREFATKAELQGFRCEMLASCAKQHDRVDKTLGELFNINRLLNKELIERLDKYHAELGDWQRGIERQIGHLEGKIDNES
jgi:hypothetical protein